MKLILININILELNKIDTNKIIIKENKQIFVKLLKYINSFLLSFVYKNNLSLPKNNPPTRIATNDVKKKYSFNEISLYLLIII